MKIRLGRIGKLAGGLGPLLALCLIVTLAVPALAGPPAFPRDHSFWGSVTIGETPAEPGTIVTATIAGVADEWTSTVVDIEGYDGYYGLNDPPAYPDNLLEVPADDPATPGITEGGVEGDTVEFWVLGKLAGDAPFVPDGTTQLSLQVIGVTYTLTMAVSGSGTTDPAVGDHSYAEDTVVDISATPALDWEFDGWSTADMTEIANASLESTTVTVDKDKTVTATFIPVEPCVLTVNANPTEGGTVSGEDTYTCGTSAPIAATPNSCYEFVDWSGADIANPNSASTTVLVDEDKTVTANFALLEYTLTATASPAEAGIVTATGMVDGIGTYDCCTTVDDVLATATDPCYYFHHWSGDLNGSTNPESIHIDGNKTVTAVFELVEPTTLTVDSTDGGSVTSPGEAVSSYPGGTVVPLVADPDPCANFINWTGDDVSTIADVDAATTTITMNDDYTITANFVPPEVLKTVTLNDGWNTFSTPLTLNQCTNTWSKLEEENNLTGLYMIYRFDVSTGYWALIMGGDPVRPLEGYYVKMTTEGETVSIIPDREPPLIPPSAELSNGLNFIGTPSLEDLNVVTALLDIHDAAGGYSKVINPDENDPWTSNIYSRDIPPAPIMVACKAYWVVMPNPGAVLVGVLPPPL